MTKKPGVLYAPTPTKKKAKAKKEAPAPSWARSGTPRSGMHYHLVIDRSGSMRGWEARTISSVNEYLGSIDLSIPSTVTVELFDSPSGYIDRQVLCRAISPNLAPRLSAYNYQPRGMTPLHDAVGLAVRDIDGMRLPTSAGVVLVVMTDGQENDSKEFNGPTVASILKARQDAGWLVIYLGANQDAVKEGARFGTQMANTMSYDMNNMNLAFAATARSSKLYASGVAAASAGFTDEERVGAADKKRR